MIQFEARLTEGAVEAAAAGGEAEEFLDQRDSIYDVEDPEDRNPLFAELHNRWFERLGLDRPVREAFAYLPQIEEQVDTCVVALAKRTSDEGAELFVRPPEPGLDERSRRRVVVRLLPATLADPERVEPLLARELLHIADMIDPAFGYQPTLPACLAGQTQDRLLMDRYTVIWATTVTGRLVRSGKLDPSVRREALERFGLMFRMLTDHADLEAAFAHFFDGRYPSHDDIVAFTQDPRVWIGEHDENAPGSGCALCRMPTHARETIKDPELEARIAVDFPDWRPTQQVCPQCAELYRTRSVVCEGEAGNAYSETRS